MKLLTALLLVSMNAFAIDMNAVKAVSAKAMEKGKSVAEACKKEQIEFCKTLTELAPLKACLAKNKEKLSAECKASIGL